MSTRPQVLQVTFGKFMHARKPFFLDSWHELTHWDIDAPTCYSNFLWYLKLQQNIIMISITEITVTDVNTIIILVIIVIFVIIVIKIINVINFIIIINRVNLDKKPLLVKKKFSKSKNSEFQAQNTPFGFP